MAMPRPVLRYHGGKFRIASWVVSHFPPHRVYVEPYGGAASVLLHKSRAPGEIYNDLDGDVVNVFRVLRDPETAEELKRLCALTPFSREDFDLAYEATDDPIERARRAVVRSFFGHGSSSRRKHRTGFRGKAYRANQSGANDWQTWPEAVPAFVERLRGVIIENRDALDVIRRHDAPDCLVYADPPYPMSTRTSVRCNGDIGRAYKHEMTDDDHCALAEVLHSCIGSVVVSGYHCELYHHLYHGWHFTERAALGDSGVRRIEVMWFNHVATSRQGRLCFDREAITKD